MGKKTETPLYVKNKQSFDGLEFYFQRLIDTKGKNVNKKQISSGISRNLYNIFGLKTEVILEENDGLDFYGMQVFPRKEVITEIASRIAANENYSIKDLMGLLDNDDWIIEIDSKLYMDKNLAVTAEEMVAALLHEIGHIVYSNSVATRIYKSYVIKKASMNQRFKNVARYNQSIFKKMFEVPIAHIFTIKTYYTDPLKSEMAADKLSVRYGYGQPLKDLIVKIIKTRGSGQINRTEDDMIQEAGIMWQWMINNFNVMHIRQKALIIALQAESVKTPLYTMRTILGNLIPQEIFNIHQGGEKDATYQLTVHEESVNRIASRYVTEGLSSLFNRQRKVKSVKQADIDHIAIEIERIESHDDKIFILDLIYDQLDLIEASEDLIENGQKELVTMSPDRIKDYKNQLQSLRQKVFNADINKKQYGLFIKYPPGYEG